MELSIAEILKTEIQKIKGVGTAKATDLSRLGIYTVGDLLRYYPRRYEDRRPVCAGVDIQGVSAAFLLEIASAPKLTFAKSFKMVKVATAEVKIESDGEGAEIFVRTDNFADLVFFNSDYLVNTFKTGDVYRFYGRMTGNLISYEMVNPKFERYSKSLSNFYPIYKKSQRLTHNYLSSIIKNALDFIKNREDSLEILPDEIREKYSLCHIGYALRNIHLPTDPTALESAKTRLVFEELFLYCLGLALFKKRRSIMPSVPLTAGTDCMADFYSALPFILTGAQKSAINEVISDLKLHKPMSRLVQGDVGSGKTIVAAAAAYYAIKNGGQVSFMVPTEILAAQHYKSLSELFGRFGIKVGLLTGSLGAAAKRELLKAAADGEISLLVGTHALIEKNVKFLNLVLAITDEQHRFGVMQRAKQADKSTATPHALVMSATPIPRTLALIMYGDLDVSIIGELPPGRQKVDTFTVVEDMRERINKFIRKLIGEGGQVFIVCPAVGDDETETGETSDGNPELANVVGYYDKLSKETFPDIPSGFIHGRLAAAKKDECMNKFAAGEYKILVSTIVIEVGVNIPDAVLMVVENAERFGLSQLHQLRGRVGRSDRKSYCVLFNGSKNGTANERLEMMCKTNDGFEIAKKDIELRGPGDLFGERQSGDVNFRIADLSADMQTLYTAAAEAKIIAEADGKLEKEENIKLRDALDALFSVDEKGKIAFN